MIIRPKFVRSIRANNHSPLQMQRKRSGLTTGYYEYIFKIGG